VSKVWFSELPKGSKWMSPLQIHYIENGMQKSRDIMKMFDAVVVILYNVSKKKLVYVRQFRPAVYHRLVTGPSSEIPQGCIDLKQFPSNLAITLELAGGLVDNGKSAVETASNEVFEECGYKIPEDRIELVYTYKSGIGPACSVHTMFYCEVCDDEKIAEGGGVHDESIQVVELSVPDSRNLVRQGAAINTGPETVLGIQWFLSNKIERY
ncbi:hypothetical protein KR222_008305, partial [Zaprionus bogoriensis]